MIIDASLLVLLMACDPGQKLLLLLLMKWNFGGQGRRVGLGSGRLNRSRGRRRRRMMRRRCALAVLEVHRVGRRAIMMMRKRKRIFRHARPLDRAGGRLGGVVASVDGEKDVDLEGGGLLGRSQRLQQQLRGVRDGASICQPSKREKGERDHPLHLQA